MNDSVLTDSWEVKLTRRCFIPCLISGLYIDAYLARFLECSGHEEIVSLALQADFLLPFLTLDVEPLELGRLVEQEGKLLTTLNVKAVAAEIDPFDCLQGWTL